MPQPLVIALYLREAAGLDIAADVIVPPLEPRVPIHAALAPYATEQAATQWLDAWDAMLDDQPDSAGIPPVFTEPLAGLPDALRSLAVAAMPAARAWFNDRKREDLDALRASGGRPGRRMGVGLGIGDLVRRAEGEQGRRAVPFNLRISLLPVTGAWARRVRSGHVLISRELCEDDDACRAFLEPVIRELAA